MPCTIIDNFQLNYILIYIFKTIFINSKNVMTSIYLEQVLDKFDKWFNNYSN